MGSAPGTTERWRNTQRLSSTKHSFTEAAESIKYGLLLCIHFCKEIMRTTSSRNQHPQNVFKPTAGRRKGVCVREKGILKVSGGGASPSVIPRGKEGIDKTTQQDCCSSRVELAGIHTMPFLHLHSHIFQLWAVTHSKYSSLCISQKTGITIPVICTLQSAPQIFGSSKYKCNK